MMLTIGRIKPRKPGMTRAEKGYTLIEVVISIMLLGIVAAALANAAGTASNVLLENGARQTAKNLAETQMEYVKGLPYDTTYIAAAIPPAQKDAYTATIAVVDGLTFSPPRDGNLQKIIVTITGPGITYKLEGYKVR